MMSVALFLFVVAVATVWVFVSYEFRRVLRYEDRETFDELLRASRRHRFSLPGAWVDFADGVELKSISNPRVRHAAARLTTVYRRLRAMIFLGPAFLLLCYLIVVVVANGI